VRPRAALRRASERRRPARGFKPVEQVLRAPVRPLVQHVHHQHLSSTTLQLHVAVGVQIASASHPIRMHVMSHRQARGPASAAATYPGVVFRDQVATAATAATVARQPAGRPLVHRPTPSPHVSAARATSAFPALRSAPPQIELVHRLLTPSALEAATHRSADARMNPTASRSGPGWADMRAPIAPGSTPLTTADLPGVVDQVVRDIDRRVVAARERRGWTS
jgi:hypothetical protein